MLGLWITLAVILPVGLGLLARHGGPWRRRFAGSILAVLGGVLGFAVLRARSTTLSSVDILAVTVAATFLTSGILWIASAQPRWAGGSRIAFPLSFLGAVLGIFLVVGVF